MMIIWWYDNMMIVIWWYGAGHMTESTGFLRTLMNTPKAEPCNPNVCLTVDGEDVTEDADLWGFPGLKSPYWGRWQWIETMVIVMMTRVVIVMMTRIVVGRSSKRVSAVGESERAGQFIDMAPLLGDSCFADPHHHHHDGECKENYDGQFSWGMAQYL